jgi:hypothetical protein
MKIEVIFRNETSCDEHGFARQALSLLERIATAIESLAPPTERVPTTLAVTYGPPEPEE